MEMQAGPGPATATPDGTYTYTITATNNGPDAAADVVVSDTVDPALVTVISVSPGCLAVDGTVTCDLGTLAVGESRVLTVTVQVNPSVRGVITNCTQDDTSTNDPDLGNNEACVNTSVAMVNPPNSLVTVSKAPC